jgi:hypothetical protein
VFGLGAILLPRSGVLSTGLSTTSGFVTLLGAQDVGKRWILFRKLAQLREAALKDFSPLGVTGRVSQARGRDSGAVIDELHPWWPEAPAAAKR